MAIKRVLKKATINQGTNWYKRSKLSDLDFADDIAALSDSTQGLQGLMSTTGEVTGGLSLLFSDKKMKIMLPGSYQPPDDVLISQNKVEVIKDLTYLGSCINNWGIMDHKISCRIGKLMEPSISSIRFGQAKFTLETKFHYYKSIVLSTLLYTCETCIVLWG